MAVYVGRGCWVGGGALGVYRVHGLDYQWLGLGFFGVGVGACAGVGVVAMCGVGVTGVRGSYGRCQSG